MSKITNTGVFIVEGASAAADVAGSGQIWVKSDAPSSLYYTDDAGTDFRMGGITLGAPTATTSGTSIDYTGIPAGVKRLILLFAGVSGTSGTRYLVQIGDSGGLETSGYTSSTWAPDNSATESTAGYIMTDTLAAGHLVDGVLELLLEDSSNNTWVAFGLTTYSTAGASYEAGKKSLSGVLDRVRLTTTSGSDAFDAGSLNIQFQ